MNRSRTIAAGLVIVLLVTFLAACGGEDTQQEPTTVSNQGTETIAKAPEATVAPDQDTGSEEKKTAEPAEDEATVTSQSEETADATTDDEGKKEVASSSENLVVGSASIEDDGDDVVNLLMQEPDDPMPGIDLRRVQIDADGNQIVVTIETEGDIAAQLSDDDDVSFDVHLWQDDKPRYAMSFHHNGSDGWEATVTDFSVGLLGEEDTVDTRIDLDGNTLSAAFPLSMMPELESSFEWYSSVMLSENGMTLNGWFDGAPENVIQLLADPDKFVEFPG